MNPIESLLTGIAPGHAAGLVAALLVIVWLAASRWLSAAPGILQRWAAGLLAVTAAVHLALPIGHQHGGPLMAVGFLASAAAYGWLAVRARNGRRWRLLSALLVLATLVAYLASVGSGAEPDQVGLATTLAELTILGLALAPAGHWGQPARRRPVARFAAATTTIFALVLVGGITWAAAFATHEQQPAVSDAAAQDSHEHNHGHAGRAQAGVIMRAGLAGHHATPEQERAAADLAERTRSTVTARYASIGAALADGYQVDFQTEGTDVHLQHKANSSDGRTLDPQRPEMLVYAIEGGKATLLGVVYVMDVAGRPGPEPGGPITRWHAHNACISLLPIGLGLVSPYGNCPAFSVKVGTPEMMHVWVVDNPVGPFAESLDSPWISAYNERYGQPYSPPK